MAPFFFFLFPVTLKHTSKGKIPSGSPVYLFCSLMTSQRVFLIQYDFSSLIPWREVWKLTTFPSDLPLSRCLPLLSILHSVHRDIFPKHGPELLLLPLGDYLLHLHHEIKPRIFFKACHVLDTWHSPCLCICLYKPPPFPFCWAHSWLSQPSGTPGQPSRGFVNISLLSRIALHFSD